MDFTAQEMLKREFELVNLNLLPPYLSGEAQNEMEATIGLYSAGVFELNVSCDLFLLTLSTVKEVVFKKECCYKIRFKCAIANNILLY